MFDMKIYHVNRKYVLDSTPDGVLNVLGRPNCFSQTNQYVVRSLVSGFDSDVDVISNLFWIF